MFQVPLAGQSINTAQIGIETNISSSSATIGNASITNATIGQLSTTIFNPASVTTTTLDANIGNIGTLIVTNPVANLPVSVLNCSIINASVKNVCNISAIHISASQITCDNLQPLLTAGTNISIVDGVISAGNDALLPSVAGFHTINSSIVNSSFFVSNLANMFHTSTVSISSNHASFVALTANNLSTGDLNFGSNLSYNAITKHLDVNTAKFVEENDERPVTSWAVYKEFVNRLTEQVNNIQSVHFFRLSDPAVTLVASQVAAGQNNVIFRVDFTPQYENSRIAVEVCYSYRLAGSGTDNVTTDLQIGTNNNQSQLVIQRIEQNWTNAGGGGTRGGDAGSIMGVYDNADTLGKFHRVQLKVYNFSDDLWQLESVTQPAIKVTEILQIDTINNPNIRIGSGNISCGNISASNISCSQITVGQFIVDGDITTNEGFNAGGGLITAGFAPNGTIAALSRIRMAGGSSLFNSADAQWDGTTFNISMRQANKNFKVSISQQEYLQVNVSNTSTRSLIVNGNLSVTGAFGVSSLVLDSLVLNGLSTFQSARFNNNVSVLGHLNSCNVSIHGNVSIVGFATISGNLSMLGNISARHISAPNLSTASLVAGQNICILNGSISAFIQGGNDIDVRNLHVDEDVQIVGLLNVSETSTFKQSLNVCNIIYAGDAGEQDGSVVVYSQQTGNNWATKFDDDKLNMSATGTTQEANIWVGGNKTLSVTATGVNISGVITASQFNFSLDNVSFTNISSVNSTATNGSFTNLSCVIITADSIVAPNVQPTLTAGTGISISNNVISGTETLTSGNNISIFNNIVSTTPNINVSSISSVNSTATNGSFTNLSCVNITANSIVAPNVQPTLTAGVGINISNNVISGTETLVAGQNISIFNNIVRTTPNINVSNLSALTITTPQINISNQDNNALNVSGIVNMDYFFTTVGQNSQIQGRNTFFGQPTPLGNESVINFFSTIGEQSIGTRMGNTSNEAFIKTSTQFGAGVNTFTMNISNTSVMSMTHSSTKYNHNVNVSGTLTATTINGANLSTATLELSSDLFILDNVLQVDFSSATAAATAEVNGLASALASNVSTTNVSAVFGTIGLLTINTLANAPTINTSILNSSDIDAPMGEIDNLSSINLSSSFITTNTLTTTGAVGIGISNPERFFHVRGANATWRLDRDRPSPALQIHRFDTNFVGAPLKGFMMGVEATSANNGFFFINDFAQNVAGGSTQRLRIENDGQVTIINKLNVGGGIIADNFSVADTNGNTIIGGTLGVTGRITTTNMSLTNSSHTLITTGTIRATTSNGTTMNASNINISTKLNVPNISSARANFTTDIITPKVTTEALNTSSSLNFNINNVPSMELGAALFMYTDIQGTNGYFTGNVSAINGSFTTLSCSTISANNLTTSNMSIGTGLNLSNNVLTAQATVLTSGPNISILNNVVSLLPNINVSTIDVNTSINAKHLNSSSVRTLALNVSGITRLDTLSVSGPSATELGTDEVTVGRRTAAGSQSFISFWDPVTPQQVAFRMGIFNDGVARLQIPSFGQFMTFNINISNQNYLTMKNNSTRFQQPVIFGFDVNATKITSTNICNTNFSSSLATITTMRSTTCNGTTMNASNLNISTKLTTTNISATNITATSIVASNVQPTLTAGTNINISNNVISATGGTSLTAGNNISILNGIVSLNPNINISNLSVINGSFTKLTCSGNISFPIGFGLYRDFTGLMNVCDIEIRGLFGSTFNATTGNFSTLNSSTLNSQSINVTGFSAVLDMGGLGSINRVGTLNSLRVNTSECNASNASIVNLSVSGSITGSGLTTANMSIGSGLSLSNNILTATGGSSLTAGNNISILNGIVSTTATISSSVHNAETMNTSIINASDIDSILGEIDNLSSINFSGDDGTFTNSLLVHRTLMDNRLGNAMVISKDNQSNISAYALAQFQQGRTRVNAGNGNVLELSVDAIPIGIISTTGMSFPADKLLEIANISSTNISVSGSITGAGLTTANMSIGSGLSLSNNILTATGGSSLTAGNNISILNGIVSLNPNINISNLSVINASFTKLTCSGNISFPIGFGLYRDFTGLMNVCDIEIKGLFGSTFNATTGNFSTLNSSTLNSQSINVTGFSAVLDMGGLGSINRVGTLTGIRVNTSECNASIGSVSTLGINTSSTRTRLSISPTVTEPKITLWDGGSTTDHYGFGVSSSQLNYHTPANHVFYSNGKNGDGLERLRINNNGFMTVTNQVRFIARRSTTLAPFTGGTIVWNTTQENVGGSYSTSTGRFTAPVRGRYFFYGYFFTNENNTFTVDFFQGSTRVHRVARESGTGAGGNTQFSTSFFRTLTAGQTMRMDRVSGSIVVAQNEFSGFGGYLMG